MIKRSSLRQKIIASPYILWTVLFVVIPVLMVVYYTFTDRNGNITFDNIINLCTSYTLITFLRSFLYGIIATLICLIIAYPFAYIMANTSQAMQRTMMMLLMIPMWTNFLILTYSWMNILKDTGLINSVLSHLKIGTIHMINTPGAAIFGMVYNFLPYMVLPIYTVMIKIDKNLIEASKDLGCNSIDVLKKIIIPLSLPGVISGITMVFVPSISNFYISSTLGGNKVSLIGDVIKTQFDMRNYNLGAAISLVLMIIILISMAAMNKLADDDEGGIMF